MCGFHAKNDFSLHICHTFLTGLLLLAEFHYDDTDLFSQASRTTAFKK